MAHPICNELDKREGKKTTPCNSACKNWQFSHLEIACVLSEVYSVVKGEPCYIFEEKEQAEIEGAL